MEEYIELKPCPFCGGNAFPTIKRGERYKALFVECEDCGVMLPIYESRLLSYSRDKKKYGETTLSNQIEWHKTEIEEKWNTRIEEGGDFYGLI